MDTIAQNLMFIAIAYNIIVPVAFKVRSILINR